MPPLTKTPYTMPFKGQVFILSTNPESLDREYIIGEIGDLKVTTRFDRKGEKPPEVLSWNATIKYGTNQFRKIGIGEAWGSGDWHPPTEVEATWPGIREALARQNTGTPGTLVPKALTVAEVEGMVERALRTTTVTLERVVAQVDEAKAAKGGLTKDEVIALLRGELAKIPALAPTPAPVPKPRGAPAAG